MTTCSSNAKKKCFKCGRRKLLKLFYVHAKMADGHLGKCKLCARQDVRSNYSENRAAKSAYSARRARDPARREYLTKKQQRYRVLHPGKYRARNAVANALRSGRLVKEPCRHCGRKDKVQAHHTDYRRPLVVQWECFKCHRELEHGQVVVAV